MAATLTAPKTIKLKADTVMTVVGERNMQALVLAGTEVSYHTEARGMGHVGVVELIVQGVPYRAERELAAIPCSCDHDTPKPALASVATPRTLVNDRDGRTVTTTLSNAELAERFGELYGADDKNWLWYWLAKTINDARPTHQGGSNVTSALDFLADSFVVAVGYGLLSPMIRVHYKDQRFKFYLWMTDRNGRRLQCGDRVVLKDDRRGQLHYWTKRGGSVHLDDPITVGGYEYTHVDVDLTTTVVKE